MKSRIRPCRVGKKGVVVYLSKEEKETFIELTKRFNTTINNLSHIAIVGFIKGFEHTLASLHQDNEENK